MDRCILCGQVQLDRNLIEGEFEYDNDDGTSTEFIGLICKDREACDERCKEFEEHLEDLDSTSALQLDEEDEEEEDEEEVLVVNITEEDTARHLELLRNVYGDMSDEGLKRIALHIAYTVLSSEF